MICIYIYICYTTDEVICQNRFLGQKKRTNICKLKTPLKYPAIFSFNPKTFANVISKHVELYAPYSADHLSRFPQDKPKTLEELWNEKPEPAPTHVSKLTSEEDIAELPSDEEPLFYASAKKSARQKTREQTGRNRRRAGKDKAYHQRWQYEPDPAKRKFSKHMRDKKKKRPSGRSEAVCCDVVKKGVKVASNQKDPKSKSEKSVQKWPLDVFFTF